MSCIILLYKLISSFCINSIYTRNYRKLFCCIDVAFCAIVMSLVFLMYYGCFLFALFMPLYYAYYYFRALLGYTIIVPTKRTSFY
jgi:hypothetical protein